MSNGLKLILIAAATVITCMVIGIGFSMERKAKLVSDAASKQLLEFYQDIRIEDYLKYDGMVVTGSDVVNVIKKVFGRTSTENNTGIAITVVSSKNPCRSYSYQDDSYLSQIQNFTDKRYIKPIDVYRGKVVKNENRVITEIIFTIE